MPSSRGLETGDAVSYDAVLMRGDASVGINFKTREWILDQDTSYAVVQDVAIDGNVAVATEKVDSSRASRAHAFITIDCAVAYKKERDSFGRTSDQFVTRPSTSVIPNLI